MALSPMMKQYLDIKEEHKDTIIFYRLGDFYEMFFNDAVTASNELGLTLTGRDCGLEERAPMCGVPYHSANNYLAKLIAKGYKVAICEQVTSPGAQKGIVDRRVVKIVTRGTVTGTDFLNDSNNNYLFSVFYNVESDCVGVAWADVSTGELGYRLINEKINIKLNEILSTLEPAEIICNETMLQKSVDLSVVKYGSVCPFSLYNEVAYDYKNAYIAVSSYFDRKDFDKLRPLKECVCAVGALLEYIKTTRKKSLSHFDMPEMSSPDAFMSIDSRVRRDLEIISATDGKKKGSLLWVLDRTSTAMGARLLKKWLIQPLFDANEINERLDCVEELCSSRYKIDEVIESLKQIKDLERINSRIADGEINPKECIDLARSLRIVPTLKSSLLSLKSERFKKIALDMDEYEPIVKNIFDAIIEDAPAITRDGGFINNGYDSVLDDYRALGGNAKSILGKLEQDEREDTGIKNLKVGFNKVYGYYIEVSKSQTNLVPYRYIRKQTVTGGERYFTEELKELEQKILGAEEKAVAREIALYEELKEKMIGYVKSILKCAKGVAYFDTLISLSVVAIDNNYTRPTILSDARYIKLCESRHPIVEKILKKEDFVPNDALLDCDENQIILITGPNMAGKSVYMRQVALVCIMAQIGSYVPAKNAEICLSDKIFTRIGASDDMSTGRSTFMVEMSEVADILENATENSLLLFDEVGRGTSTYDGLSIAHAMLEYLSERYNSKIMFSTHYHELTDLEGKLRGLKNYKLTIREFNNTIIFMRKVLRGSANKSFGIEVAGISGLPIPLLERAKEVLKKLETANINSKNNTVGSQMSLFNNVVQDEIISVIKDIDADNISPRHALDILIDLKEKVRKQ